MVAPTEVFTGCTLKPSLNAAPGVPVAVKVALALPDEATSVLAPVVVPSVQLPTAALPLAAVVGVATVTDPPPVATVNVTAAPLIAVLPESTTVTSGGIATAVFATAD